MINQAVGKRILVTGATGFLGSHLVRRLIEMGHFVYGLSRTPLELKLKNYHHLSLDLCAVTNQVKLPKNIDVVFHCAGMDGNSSFKTINGKQILSSNVGQTLNLLRLLDKTKFYQIIYISSVELLSFVDIDQKSGKLKWESNLNQLSEYALSKLISEVLIGDYVSRHHKVLFKVARLANLYGPGDTFDNKRIRLIPKVIQATDKNREVEITGNLNFAIHATYIDDCVRILIKHGIKKDRRNFIIANPRAVSLQKIVDTIGDLFQRKIKIINSDPNKKSFFASKKWLKFVDKNEKYTSISTGIQKTIEWYINQSKIEIGK